MQPARSAETVKKEQKTLTTEVYLVKVVHRDEKVRIIYGKVCALGKRVLARPIIPFESEFHGRVV
jgi:hypothetical protein